MIRACNDADTLIANKTLEMSFHGDVKLKAEDTDIVCLLVNHFDSEHHNDIYLTTKKGTYSVREITSHLDHKEKEILLNQFIVFQVVIASAICLVLARLRC